MTTCRKVKGGKSFPLHEDLARTEIKSNFRLFGEKQKGRQEDFVTKA